MLMTTLVLAVALAAAPPADKGPIALRIDGPAPVRVTTKVPLPGPLPADMAKSLTGLSNAERDGMREKLRRLAKAELEAAGFRVTDADTEGVPLFIVFADARLEKS